MRETDDRLQSYLAPPRRSNDAGRERRVGLEVELGNLSLEQTLASLASALGGVAQAGSLTLGQVRDTRVGDFRVEFDWKALQERRYLRPLELLGFELESATAQRVEDSVLRIAKEFVPVEIVSPPIAWNRLCELDPLWLVLREAGAEGTRDSMLYAFGLHLNPELPSTDLPTILSYLRAFLILEDWIIAQADIDLARRFSPFIRPFSAAYKQLVLSPEYAPRWDVFVDDYVLHNPTRNRTLDFLPLFRHLQPTLDLADRVDTWRLVNARPTLHYRLPNCEIANCGWSPAIDWNRWVQVERLAEQPDTLAALRADYLRLAPSGLSVEPWIQHVQKQLSALNARFSQTW